VAEDIANVEEARYWNTAESRHWVEYQHRHDAVLAPLDGNLLAAAGISDRDHVLDVGCGCGATTRAVARAAVAGDATGIDLSASMLERARAVAEEEGLTNVSFQQGDAQVHAFDGAAFDVVISRFGVMFFADPTAAFANIAWATRERGRLVFVCWQGFHQNDWILVPASAALTHVPAPALGPPDDPGPFSFADANRVRSILSAAGWHDVDMQEVKEGLPLGDDVDEAVTFILGIRFFRRCFTDVDEATVGRAIDSVRDALVSYETPSGVFLGSAAWLVSGRR
jgi:SAM-dependent methyltransferase